MDSERALNHQDGWRGFGRHSVAPQLTKPNPSSDFKKFIGTSNGRRKQRPTRSLRFKSKQDASRGIPATIRPIKCKSTKGLNEIREGSRTGDSISAHDSHEFVGRLT